MATELRGGAVTFATMSYIVFVQPAVLSQAAGMDFGAVMTATCLSAALATLVMGLWANYPIAQAPLMGENFFFAIIGGSTMFAGALFFAPVVAMVGGGVRVGDLYYYPITAPVVILVGSLMMGQASRIGWPDPTEAIPAFVTLTLIPFTFNIAHGVAGGIVAYVLVKAGAGRRREVSRLMWTLAAVLVAAYALLPRLRH